MKIAFFGSSLVSAYWNGAATYYRGMIRALNARGHSITFYEPDAYDRQRHRDIEDPPWARVVVYPPTRDDVARAIDDARTADLIVKASGVGVFDDFLEAELLNLKTPSNLVVFWDVDAPATLDRIRQNRDDPFGPLVPRYDAVFTYGGGIPVMRAYSVLGARACVPVYNALDPETHHPVEPAECFAGHLGFLGNRLPDREARVNEFFVKPSAELPEMQFVLGGAGWDDKPLPPNVRYSGHIYTRDHNAFNCSSLAVLNVSRDSMATCGYSPATRVFEAAGAAACIITDWWRGVEMFFEPGHEILLAHDAQHVIEHLKSLTAETARIIGRAAYRRALAHHTYRERAAQVEEALDGRFSVTAGV